MAMLTQPLMILLPKGGSVLISDFDSSKVKAVNDEGGFAISILNESEEVGEEEVLIPGFDTEVQAEMHLVNVSKAIADEEPLIDLRPPKGA